MKTQYKLLSRICSVALLVGCYASAQQPAPVLHSNGQLAWTNTCTNGTFSLQWAPNLAGTWSAWDSYNQVSPTGSSMTIDVPMYFRLMVDTNDNRFVPPDDKILMIIGQDTNAIDQYVAASGITPGGVMLYTSVQNAEGLTSPFAGGGGTQYGQYLVDTYTNSVLQIGLYMVGALDGVLAGTYDSSIQTLENWIGGLSCPVYLRIGYEFDADWTNYDTGKYVQVYRYIVDRFRSNGVDNVAYVWHSQGYAVRHDPMAWYPGDGYVDWVAVSVFGNPYGINKPYVDRIVEIAEDLNKPLMIAEASPHGITSTNGVDSWTAWYAPVLQFVEENDVKAFSYINCDWNAPEMWQFSSLNWGDARVQSDPDVLALWLYTATNSPFLHGDTNLFPVLW